MVQALNIAMAMIGVIGFVIAVIALIEIKALKSSTHKIQWVPANNPTSSLNDKSSPGGDNGPVGFDELDDELFVDDIDLFLDKKPRKKKDPEEI